MIHHSLDIWWHSVRSYAHCWLIKIRAETVSYVRREIDTDWVLPGHLQYLWLSLLLFFDLFDDCTFGTMVKGITWPQPVSCRLSSVACQPVSCYITLGYHDSYEQLFLPWDQQITRKAACSISRCIAGVDYYYY